MGSSDEQRQVCPKGCITRMRNKKSVFPKTLLSKTHPTISLQNSKKRINARLNSKALCRIITKLEPSCGADQAACSFAPRAPELDETKVTRPKAPRRLRFPVNLGLALSFSVHLETRHTFRNFVKPRDIGVSGSLLHATVQLLPRALISRFCD